MTATIFFHQNRLSFALPSLIPYNNLAIQNYLHQQRRRFATTKLKTIKGVDHHDDDDEWNERYEELKRQLNESGPDSLSKVLESSPVLKKWIQTQRTAFAHWKEDKPSDMTLNRQEKLDQMGIPWREFNDWFERYLQLEQYYYQHGDCIVPKSYQENPELWKWVQDQRRSFRNYKLRKKSKTSWTMSKRRVAMLDRLGFELNVMEARWMRRYNELVSYQETHGNSLVNVTFTDNPALARWVQNQRYCYRKHRESSGRKSTGITEERIQMLDKIGFDWDPYETQWTKRYNELMEYKERHGNCLVPFHFSENRELGNWVHAQRKAYHAKTRRRGGSSTTSETTVLSDDRIQKLEQIGFDWDSHEWQWTKRYNELIEYKARNGHCWVPYNYSENPELAMWVQLQRKSFQARKRGASKKSKLTLLSNDRVQKLEQIGFEWYARNSSDKQKTADKNSKSPNTPGTTTAKAKG